MSYKTYDQVVDGFKTLCTTYPQSCRDEIIGKSVAGKDIHVFKIGPSWGGKVFWSVAIHGVEIVNTEIIWLYANWLLQQKEPAASRILTRNLNIILPIQNVDEYRIRRKNYDNVDLNRNYENGWCGGSTDPTRYDYKGTASLSELESQAVHNLNMHEKPKWFIDMHTGEPYNLYRASGTTAYINHINSVIANYRQIAQSRGQNPNEYIYQGMSPAGRCTECGSNHGAYALLWEFNPIEITLTNGPPFADVEPIWFPKFLPMAIALNQDVEVATPPPSPVGILSAATLIIIIGLFYALRRR
jgi:hypothetical protein